MAAIINSLSFSTTASKVKKASVGKGYFLVGDELADLLNEAKTTRETLVDMGLQYNRRSYNGGHYYFISNPGKQPVSGWVPLQSTEKNIALFDPMLEKNGLAKTRLNNGMVDVYLQLQPGESCILQTSKNIVTGKQYPYYKATAPVLELNNNWSLQFIKGGPSLPAAASNISVGSWTDLPGEAVKQFSGTAVYTVSFNKPKATPVAWLLNLGNVQETAEVWLNGNKLQTLIGPTFQLVIDPALLNATNILKVIVTNGMPNRIAALEKSGMAWKKFYNTNFPSGLAANRGADGLFTAINWQPKPAGLLGPVTISPLTFAQ